MNIQKAIEILTEWKEPESVADVLQLSKAKELGIEALRHIGRGRELGVEWTKSLLPGETEE